MNTFEKLANGEGYRRIAGVDETGREPLAGPLSLPPSFSPDYANSAINDSKLSARKRDEHARLSRKLSRSAWALRMPTSSTGSTSSGLRCRRARSRTGTFICPDFLLVDGLGTIRWTCRREKRSSRRRPLFPLPPCVYRGQGFPRPDHVEIYHRQFPQYNFLQRKKVIHGRAPPYSRRDRHARFIAVVSFKRPANRTGLVMKTKDMSRISTGKKGRSIATSTILRKKDIGLSRSIIAVQSWKSTLWPGTKTNWFLWKSRPENLRAGVSRTGSGHRKTEKKMSQLALWYLREKKQDQARARFDVVAVLMEPSGNEIRWIPNAFDFIAS